MYVFFKKRNQKPLVLNSVEVPLISRGQPAMVSTATFDSPHYYFQVTWTTVLACGITNAPRSKCSGGRLPATPPMSAGISCT